MTPDMIEKFQRLVLSKFPEGSEMMGEVSRLAIQATDMQWVRFLDAQPDSYDQSIVFRCFGEDVYWCRLPAPPTGEK